MKKIAVFAVSALIIASLAACGGKKDAAETTAASTETTGMPSSEALDTNTAYATVQKLDGTKLSVESDDGRSLTLDVSNAKMNSAWELAAGDEVEIGFEGSELSDGMAVLSVDMSVPFEYTSEDYTEDPSVYGTITAIDDNSVTVQIVEDEHGNITDGNSGPSKTFKRASYGTVVSKAGAVVGAAARFSFYGELDADPVCYRICTEDMMDDEASDDVAIVGTLDKVEDGILYVSVTEGNVFKFQTEDDKVLSDASALTGKKVQVTFSDALKMRVSTAVKVELAK